MAASDGFYGVSGDDPRVLRAMEATGEHCWAMLRAMFCAAFAYEREDDPSVLVRLARDVIATAQLRDDPGYDKLAHVAAQRSGGPGRSLDEVFADLGR
ncbi:MAG TPA: hypothetical protein VHN80_30180 [Kineosporiaceae bacterium]|jgi:hypothetical protein|nr:hypothetical protein [Kineosporiaceae bacterium]